MGVFLGFFLFILERIACQLGNGNDSLFRWNSCILRKDHISLFIMTIPFKYDSDKRSWS